MCVLVQEDEETALSRKRERELSSTFSAVPDQAIGAKTQQNGTTKRACIESNEQSEIGGPKSISKRDSCHLDNKQQNDNDNPKGVQGVLTDADEK